MRAITKLAIRAMDLKLSTSRSSTEVVTPNSRSSWRSSSTNASESSTPVSNRSVSAEGTSRCRAPENKAAIRSGSPFASHISNLLVLRGQQIEPQTVVGAAVDVVALSLSANRPEFEAFGDLDRRVVLDDPGMDRTKAELLESERQHLRACSARIPLAGVRLVAKHHPDVRGFEVRVDVAQADDADRRVIEIGRENPQRVAAALHRDLQPFRAHQLAAVSEVQPLVVFLLGQPVRDQLEMFRRIGWFELHGRRSSPRRLP